MNRKYQYFRGNKTDKGENIHSRLPEMYISN